MFYKRPSLRRGGMPTGIETIAPRKNYNIAGIVSLNKRILGMMPHPERYTDIKEKDIVMKQMIGSML